ncbi:MAG: type II toxin-antitoxin system RelE/ParE family toxin [Candidatus Omnitrophica bacterium]|nr:type II toxin-antitoxin system RelE/ParE family toxin [Candidatus Omnitrophota bacterium]
MGLYDRFLLYEGRHYSIFFHSQNGYYSEVYEYFEQCDAVTQAGLLFLAIRRGDVGRILDPTRFRVEDKENKICVFKPKQERFFCFFFAGKTIVITSGCRKQKQKLDKNELMKAIKIRRQYFN